MNSVKGDFKEKIFKVVDNGLNALALEIFYYQAKNNPVYSKFLHLIDIRPESIIDAVNIPYLPVEFFKNHQVVCTPYNKDIPNTLEIRKDESLSSPNIGNMTVFTSSSTTGTGVAKHYVPDLDIYHQSLVNSFELHFGKPEDFTFRFLLPSYLERGGSSLVYMANYLLKLSGKGGFYINDYKALATDLEKDIHQENKVILLGVSFALMDFADAYPMNLSQVTIIETGGMKGRKKEITRYELHDQLKEAFKTEKIASEYGMTELLSQAYSLSHGLFTCPPWMRLSIRSTTDPFAKETQGKTGGINIMDLANIDSCCFLATSDLGRQMDNGCFEVLGRFDNSDIRGCSLLAV